MRASPKQGAPLTLKRVVVLVISFAVGVVLAAGIAESTATVGPVGPIIFLAYLVGAIFVHELGHLIGAAMVGFQVKSFAVGPLMLCRERDGFRLRRSHFKLGGMVTAVPVGSHDLRRRMLVMTAAGPISSVLFALLAFVPAHVLSGRWSDLIVIFSVFSAGLALLSLLPTRKFYLSDGAQIFDMLRFPDRGDRQCALLALAEAANNGSRPRDWDPLLIGKALAFSDGSGRDVLGNIMAYEQAMDRREFDVAERHLESTLNLRQKCPAKLKSGIALDAAFFNAMVRAENVAAREWFQECNASDIRDRYFLLMVEASVLLVEGNFDQALRRAEESVSTLPQAQFPGFAAAAQEWLELISKQARKKVSLTPDHTLAELTMAVKENASEASIRC
ncbi:MAG TPA: site-2 protease family protein [Terriglobales bacterium]|nr:site-2 protease family protein [Terriglobales bacterium]